jgi:hypothetical protein
MTVQTRGIIDCMRVSKKEQESIREEEQLFPLGVE